MATMRPTRPLTSSVAVINRPLYVQPSAPSSLPEVHRHARHVSLDVAVLDGKFLELGVDREDLSDNS